jgi:hypothetical protein
VPVEVGAFTPASSTIPLLFVIAGVPGAGAVDPDHVFLLSMVLTALRHSALKPVSDSASSRRSSLPDSRSAVDRNAMLARARTLDAEAERAAQDGDIDLSAQKILAALDCERRAGTVGPQVLQLIKPRA